MSQKTDKMLKLALVFFISLLSFSIGTFVGKKYSDNQYKLAMLEPSKNKANDLATQDFAANSDEKLNPAGAAKNPAEQQLTDNEVAKIAEEFALDSSEANATDDVNSEKDIPVTESQVKDIKTINPDKKPMPKVVATKPAAATAVVKNNTKPAVNMVQIQTVIDKVKKMETREVASIPTTNQYTVQVGSFPTQAEADKLSHDLVNKGYKASAVPAAVNGQTWHRVHVGLFGTVKEAQDYKKDFLEKTKLSSAIVQRVQK